MPLMAIPSGGDQGSSAHDALTGIAAGLHEVTASMSELAGALLKAAIGFADLQMLVGIVIGAGGLLLVLLLAKAVGRRHANSRSGKSQHVALSASGAMDDLHALPLDQVEKKLDSSPEGLSQAEAAKRLEHYGPNEIAEEKANV
jgi:magnesium-transporting ATPase (P-type)